MIKCIASDMDGTLLSSKQTVSEENRTVIKQAQKAGIEFVVATGRSYQEAIYLLQEAGISCPIISTNGAEIRSETGERIASFPLQGDKARKIADYLDQKEMYYEVFTNEGTYIKDYQKGLATIIDILSSANPYFDTDRFLENAKERIERGSVRVVDDYQPLFVDPNIEILKILAFSLDVGKKKEVEQYLLQFDVAVSSSGYDNLEITDIHAQKGLALEYFTRERKIKMEETMAIGDSYNDLSMFSRVGLAVAMGNANAEIKEKADQVTATNDENGVAKAILQSLKISNPRE
ncbi:Cof-type HAD-IIB family hydrolase [Tepidibacillus sp. LV47]|uniref:Cof-type HAD-IIB family hydrolase n=1 Tax=Tepidibacillus sp. LV47 TaxID=3398228 RepID=UPI003AB0848F